MRNLRRVSGLVVYEAFRVLDTFVQLDASGRELRADVSVGCQQWLWHVYQVVEMQERDNFRQRVNDAGSKLHPTVGSMFQAHNRRQSNELLDLLGVVVRFHRTTDEELGGTLSISFDAPGDLPENRG